MGDPWGFDAGQLAVITDWYETATETGGSGDASGRKTFEYAIAEDPN